MAFRLAKSSLVMPPPIWEGRVRSCGSPKHRCSGFQILVAGSLGALVFWTTVHCPPEAAAVVGFSIYQQDPGMARRVTEAKAAGVSKWIVDHVNRRRRYCPPRGPKLRKELRHECKALAGRYYQFLSGHAATGDCLCRRMHKLPPDRCWWCGQDERQTRHHLFVNCAA